MSLAKQVAALEAEHDRLKSSVQGNVILLRRDGFSRPMSVHVPHYGYGADPAFPYYIETFVCDFPFHPMGANAEDPAVVSHRRERFRLTGKKDTFGRAVYEEV